MILENHEYDNADVFNKIRKVLEWVMLYCNDIGLLSVKFKGTNLNECSKFLGDPKMLEVIPVYVQRSFHSAVTISNGGSHRDCINHDTKEGIAPYLVQSTVYELLNIIIWLQTLPTGDEDIAARRAKTDKIYLEVCSRHKI